MVWFAKALARRGSATDDALVRKERAETLAKYEFEQSTGLQFGSTARSSVRYSVSSLGIPRTRSDVGSRRRGSVSPRGSAAASPRDAAPLSPSNFLRSFIKTNSGPSSPASESRSLPRQTSTLTSAFEPSLTRAASTPDIVSPRAKRGIQPRKLEKAASTSIVKRGAQSRKLEKAAPTPDVSSPMVERGPQSRSTASTSPTPDVSSPRVERGPQSRSTASTSQKDAFSESNSNCVMVTDLKPGSLCYMAGLKKGDVITHVNLLPVKSAADVAAIVGDREFHWLTVRRKQPNGPPLIFNASTMPCPGAPPLPRDLRVAA